MTKLIQYDYSFMLSDVVGEHGATMNDLAGLQSQMLEMRTSHFSKESPLGFMTLPFETETVNTVKQLAEEVAARFSTLIVLGIGGSDLGARATIQALPSSGMTVLFLGSNTDPIEIEQTLNGVSWPDTAVNVISKSGDTIETMSTFIYIRDQLKKSVGDSFNEHIIAATDASTGTLRTIAEREKYRTLVVPENVGGRFSVLSTVGLFPIACAGVDIVALLEGSRDLCLDLNNFDNTKMHGVEIFSALHFLGFTQKNQNVHVFIPYATSLRNVGFWFRQLWAESLGKHMTVDGQTVYTGPTPVAALGATDQHSQFQLYYYGPFDKLITFVDVEDYGSDLEVPEGFEDIEGISYTKGLRFEKILRSELQASSLALAERKRPNGRLILPEISAYTIGQLFQFLEIATVYVGFLLRINPFDQPGVELGKQNMYAILGRKGFEKRNEELQQLMKFYAKRVV